MTNTTKISEKEFKALEQLKTLFGTANQQYWQAAEILYQVRERKGYKQLGYDTLEDYCEDGLNKSRQVVTQLLRAYEVAVVHLQYKPENLPEYSKVYLVSEFMEHDPENADEWLEKARALSVKDLKDEKRESKLGTEARDCKHKDATIIVLRTCPDCGLKWRDFKAEDTLFNIKQKYDTKST